MTRAQRAALILSEARNKASLIIKELKKFFPQAKITLDYSNNWELLVAVILSAQCTDKKVNEVTEALFKKYRTLNDYVNADVRQFEKDIRSTGFYHNKAKHILASAKIIKEKFGGKIPRTMPELLTLPGVARKTANIILGNAYGIVEGIAVDTHVKRLSRVLGLTSETNPDKIEKDLMEIIPKNEWFDFTYRLIDYGRKYCPAKPHDHANCSLTKAFKSAKLLYNKKRSIINQNNISISMERDQRGGFGPRKMFKGNWTCSECGTAITELPFQPSQDRPLYCRDCLFKRRNAR